MKMIRFALGGKCGVPPITTPPPSDASVRDAIACNANHGKPQPVACNHRRRVNRS
jgi:hypothetical protein